MQVWDGASGQYQNWEYGSQYFPGDFNEEGCILLAVRRAAESGNMVLFNVDRKLLANYCKRGN